MKKQIAILILIFASLTAKCAVTSEEIQQDKKPWLTGPLLNSSYSVVPLGHVNYEPFLYATSEIGRYDAKGTARGEDVLRIYTLEQPLQVGLTKWMNFQITPTFSYNYRDHRAKWVLEDLPFYLQIQMLAPKDLKDPKPYLLFILGEVFPTGKYQKLDPQKKGADIGGAGSYQSIFSFVLGKLFHLKKEHYISPSVSIQYILPASVNVRGFNNYGGGYGTKARIYPAQSLIIDGSFELTLSKNWALACDLVGQWQNSTRFKGDPGLLDNGKKAPLGSPSGTQFSLAPALEYNFNANLGLIGGGWFTFMGRNAGEFWSLVLALNYYK